MEIDKALDHFQHVVNQHDCPCCQEALKTIRAALSESTTSATNSDYATALTIFEKFLLSTDGGIHGPFQQWCKERIEIAAEKQKPASTKKQAAWDIICSYLPRSKDNALGEACEIINAALRLQEES
jgi:hypothetical protein